MSSLAHWAGRLARRRCACDTGRVFRGRPSSRFREVPCALARSSSSRAASQQSRVPPIAPSRRRRSRPPALQVSRPARGTRLPPPRTSTFVRFVRSCLAVDRAYAEAAKSMNLIEALVAPLAPEGVFLAPGPVFLRGPDAARALLSATPNNALSKWSWTAIRVDVSSDGKEGYTMGYSELTQPSGTVLPGRYSPIGRSSPTARGRPRPTSASRARRRGVAHAPARFRDAGDEASPLLPEHRRGVGGGRRRRGRSGVQRSRAGRGQRRGVRSLCGADGRAIGEFGECRLGLRAGRDRGAHAGEPLGVFSLGAGDRARRVERRPGFHRRLGLQRRRPNARQVLLGLAETEHGRVALHRRLMR